jgi:dTMP kinase
MFITFEGPEGAGKTTLIKALEATLILAGSRVLATREPGAGSFGQRVRSLLLDGDTLNPRAELFLFLADRAEHIASIVNPALADGKIVLCDRHIDSTVVYQGYGRGFDVQQLRDWNAFATGGRLPDLTLLLDLDPAVGLARGTKLDRLDREPIEFHQKIRTGFLAEAARYPNRIRTLDASVPTAELAAKAYELIQQTLAAKAK